MLFYDFWSYGGYERMGCALVGPPDLLEVLLEGSALVLLLKPPKIA